MHPVIRFLCPRESRQFTGKRWLKISLRTLHLVGIAGLAGGILFKLPVAQWHGYLVLTMVSGFCYLGLELWSNGIWFIQLRGITIFVKLGLVYVMMQHPDQAWWVVIIIVLSSVISHAPGNVRYFSPWHRRRVDHL